MTHQNIYIFLTSSQMLLLNKRYPQKLWQLTNTLLLLFQYFVAIINAGAYIFLILFQMLLPITCINIVMLYNNSLNILYFYSKLEFGIELQYEHHV